MRGFWQNEYNSILNQEMGSPTLDFGNLLASVPCLVFYNKQYSIFTFWCMKILILAFNA